MDPVLEVDAFSPKLPCLGLKPTEELHEALSISASPPQTGVFGYRSTVVPVSGWPKRSTKVSQAALPSRVSLWVAMMERPVSLRLAWRAL